MSRTVDDQAFWDRHAKRDPLWAILSDPTKAGRRWDLSGFLETGKREVSLLMYQLRALKIEVDRRAAASHQKPDRLAHRAYCAVRSALDRTAWLPSLSHGRNHRTCR